MRIEVACPECGTSADYEHLFWHPLISDLDNVISIVKTAVCVECLERFDINAQFSVNKVEENRSEPENFTFSIEDYLA